MQKAKSILAVVMSFFLALPVITGAEAAGTIAEPGWNVATLTNKGIAEFKAENYEAALEFFLKAREEQPKLSTPVYYLGLTYKQLGDYNQAVNNLAQALELTPRLNANDIYFEVADAYYSLGDMVKAKEWVAKEERGNLRQVKTLFLKGLIFLKDGDFKAAINVFTKVRALDKSMSKAAGFLMATAYSSDRQVTKAREVLKPVLMNLTEESSENIQADNGH